MANARGAYDKDKNLTTRDKELLANVKLASDRYKIARETAWDRAKAQVVEELADKETLMAVEVLKAIEEMEFWKATGANRPDKNKTGLTTAQIKRAMGTTDHATYQKIANRYTKPLPIELPPAEFTMDLASLAYTVHYAKIGNEILIADLVMEMVPDPRKPGWYNVFDATWDYDKHPMEIFRVRALDSGVDLMEYWTRTVNEMVANKEVTR